jgi:beta-N-acetylhexosaminidase
MLMINRRAFIIGIKSSKLSPKEILFLKKYKPWGIILFSRNIISIKQCTDLTKNIRSIFKDKNYPILVDQEGGRVNRLQNILDLSMFNAKFFGNLYITDKKKFNFYYKLFIYQTSYMLKKIGININTVPVLDIKKQNSHNIIGDRSFSKNPKVVSNIGDFCIKYFHKYKIGTVIKHIPGHGSAKVDSHKFTPIVNEKLRKLIKNDFFPFRNKKSLFAMTAHIIYRDLDRFNTATHSSKVLKYIRENIKFKHILISDDLSMKGLKYSIETNTTKAFSAGCNLVLHCNGKYSEMLKVAKNSPIINNFIIKKTSLFYKILS